MKNGPSNVDETPSFLLDTHIWVRYMNGDSSLRAKTVRTIESARMRGAAFVSVISIWEVAMLVDKGRLRLPMNLEAWVKRALELPGIHLLNFSPDIAIETVRLPQGMHKDPSDRILVASARVERLTLVTLDKAIVRFAQLNHLPFLQA